MVTPEGQGTRVSCFWNYCGPSKAMPGGDSWRLDSAFRERLGGRAGRTRLRGGAWTPCFPGGRSAGSMRHLLPLGAEHSGAPPGAAEVPEPLVTLSALARQDRRIEELAGLLNQYRRMKEIVMATQRKRTLSSQRYSSRCVASRGSPAGRCSIFIRGRPRAGQRSW